jgi:hypothetical protein
LALAANKTLNGPPHKDVERWDLVEYIEVAHHLKLISDESRSAAKLAQGFRNLIHPGRSQRLGQVCDIARVMSAIAAVEHVARDMKCRQTASQMPTQDGRYTSNFLEACRRAGTANLTPPACSYANAAGVTMSDELTTLTACGRTARR